VPVVPTAGASTVNGTVIGSTFSGSTAPVRADGSFEVGGLTSGTYTVNCTAPARSGQSWILRSALIAGRDVLDAGLDVSLGADMSGAVLTLTDRRSELTGSLTTSAGLPAPDYFVIVLPVDPALWTISSTTNSRRVRSTRPASDGRFSFIDLPAGEYLLVALTDVEPNEWQKPSFLADIAPAGVKVSIGHGEKKAQDLRIKSGS
jgi:hypothetical protein